MDVAAVLALPLREVCGSAEGVVKPGLGDIVGSGEESLEVAIEVVHLKVNCQQRVWLVKLRHSPDR